GRREAIAAADKSVAPIAKGSAAAAGSKGSASTAASTTPAPPGIGRPVKESLFLCGTVPASSACAPTLKRASRNQPADAKTAAIGKPQSPNAGKSAALNTSSAGAT